MTKKRKNGTGSIHLRKDGRWEGRVVIGYDENNWPKTKNVLAKTKTECVRKLNELKKGCEEQRSTAHKYHMTFGEWLDFWYQNDSKPALRPTTQQHYELMIYKHAIPGLGKIPLKKLTQSDLQRFFNEMKQTGRINHVQKRGMELSDRTVRSCYSVCQMALERVVQENLIPVNPILGCKLPPKKGEEMKILTQEEMQRFLMQAKEEGFYDLFLLELTTGMRRGELLALKWEDLDFSTGALQISKEVCPVNGKLTVSEPKTKAGNRTIILPPAMLELMREYRKGVFSEWIFPSKIKAEQPLDPTYVRKRLQAILKRADCKHVRFHDLRHTFATMSLEHGMDIKTLSAIIGHALAETTLDHYAHSTSEMQRNAAISIEQGIAGVEPKERGTEEPEKAASQTFEPKKLSRRRPGTECVSQIRENLWEGRYSPKWIDGKKHARNVYAHSEQECEEKLAQLILEMKAELAELRAAQNNSKL